MAIFRDNTKDAGNHSDRSAGDQRRHFNKVKKVIQDNIHDILADESIIGQSKDKVVKVPIRGVREWRFIFGDNAPGVGSGSDGDQPGQPTIDGKGPKAGDQPGVDYYETEVLLDALIDMMFADLELPHQERKKLREIVVESKHKNLGYRKKGIVVRLSRGRTARERIKRLQSTLRTIKDLEDELQKAEVVGDTERAETLSKRLKELRKVEKIYQSDKAFREYLKAHPHEEGRFTFRREDRRYKHHKVKPRKESNAAVICVMDTSGSMDTMKKYLARSFFFLLYRFLQTKYANVEIRFVAHHTEAQEVTEEEFFHKGESGGTFISSGYQKAVELIQEHYSPDAWNNYVFHCSDGDNFESDDERATKLIYELCKLCNMVGYVEIKPSGSGYYGNSMISKYANNIKLPNFQASKIQHKSDIWPTFKNFMSKDKRKGDDE